MHHASSVVSRAFDPAGLSADQRADTPCSVPALPKLEDISRGVCWLHDYEALAERTSRAAKGQVCAISVTTGEAGLGTSSGDTRIIQQLQRAVLMAQCVMEAASVISIPGIASGNLDYPPGSLRHMSKAHEVSFHYQ